jgi:glutamyl-tRNA reductase
MEFGYIGINYQDANQDVRDRVSFTDNQKIDFMQRAQAAGMTQCMVLSTCNRSEVYFFVQEPEREMEMLRAQYLETFAESNLDGYVRSCRGKEALSYLFRVTSGLASMVLGEDQILGQVREAFELSRTLGCTGKELNKVVRDAITCAKKIKTQLRISEKPLSVSYVGIRQLEEKFGIEGRHALVVGSGKTAVLALRYLYEYQAAQVTVCSRTFSHAKELLEEFPKLRIVPYEKRYEAMQDCEIVVSATSSPHHVIRRAQVQMTQPMAFLDLASPRDIETVIGKEALLFNLDSLGRIVEQNKRQREALVEQGQQMIDEALVDTTEWLQTTGVDSTIESLQQRCGEIVEDSYAYLNRKLDLNARDQKLLKKILKASLHRLLREPILELKQTQSKEQQEEYERVLRELFQIE